MPCRFCKTLKLFGDKASVAENRILRKDAPPVLFIGGKPLTDYEVNELAMEVGLLKKTTLWKVMTATISAHAVNLGIRNATDFDGTMFAKSMLHNVGLLEGVMESIEAEKQRRRPPTPPVKIGP